MSAALEPAAAPDADAPVRACHRYLSNRLDHLDYQGALAQGWPVGSGEIESAHRYGTPDNAEAMLAWRITRANGQWSTYWQDDLKQTA